MYETVEEIKDIVNVLEKKFNTFKKVIIEKLEKEHIQVSKVAGILTSLSLDDEDRHKLFLESRVKVLYGAKSHSELFGTMDFHWNYHDPSLLKRIAEEFKFSDIVLDINTYKIDLCRFRKKIPIILYSRAHKKHINLTEGFQEVVIEFNWAEDSMLEDAELFREKYASNYGLHEFAMMLNQIRPGSIVVSWIVPESIINRLKCNIPEDIFKKFAVISLHIGGICIYNLHEVRILAVKVCDAR